ncbi:MAG: hypothetical protein GY811_16335 [Myxococcales bacterium]|nr:hypothetical protein [Myxococcales bacterium]
MVRQGFDRAKRLVPLSDGAAWIRSPADWLPVKVTHILDLYHVKHRIWEMAAAIYGDKTPQTCAWAKAQCERVEEGNATKVIEALASHRKRHRRIRQLPCHRNKAEALGNALDGAGSPRYGATACRSL